MKLCTLSQSPWRLSKLCSCQHDNVLSFDSSDAYAQLIRHAGQRHTGRIHVKSTINLPVIRVLLVQSLPILFFSIFSDEDGEVDSFIGQGSLAQLPTQPQGPPVSYFQNPGGGSTVSSDPFTQIQQIPDLRQAAPSTNHCVSGATAGAIYVHKPGPTTNDGTSYGWPCNRPPSCRYPTKRFVKLATLSEKAEKYLINKEENFA